MATSPPLSPRAEPTPLSAFTRRFAALVAAGPLRERMWRDLPRKQRTPITTELRAIRAELLDTTQHEVAWQAVLAALNSSSSYSVT